MNNLKTENHEFQIHPSIIYSLITAQASGVEKALLELVMNSVDAGATRIDVTLDRHGFVVADNGQGFADMQAIESCFGVFGLPHAEGDAFYGKFRLGRAQCMGYAKTEWHTKNYKMYVDLNLDPTSSSYGYQTEEVDEYYQGCVVKGTFYKTIDECDPFDLIDLSYCESPYSVYSPIIALALSVKYLPVDIYINDQKANVNRESVFPYCEKDGVSYYLTPIDPTETVYEQEVQVYNKGVFAYSLLNYGLSGDIVTDNAINLNMARNEPKSTCPVAKKIKRQLSKLSQDVMQKFRPDADESKTETCKIYVGNFWEKLLGVNNEGFDDLTDLTSMLDQRWFEAANNETIGYEDLAKSFTKLVYSSDWGHTDTADRNIYFYSDEQLKGYKLLNNEADNLVIGNGFLPIELFPSEEVLIHLHSSELSFDVNQFEGLEEFNELIGLSEIPCAIEGAMSLNQRRQALCCFLAKVLLWLSFAYNYYRNLYGYKYAERIGLNEVHREISDIRHINIQCEKHDLSSEDISEKNWKYMEVVLGLYKEFWENHYVNLGNMGCFRPEKAKEIKVDYYDFLLARRSELVSLNLNKFQEKVLHTLSGVLYRLDADIVDRWNPRPYKWFKDHGVNPCQYGERKLYLSRLEEGVMACTDIYSFVKIDYDYFVDCLDHQRYDLLVYLLMHEVAHCNKESSDLHGEVFHQGLHVLLQDFKSEIACVEYYLSEFVLNKAHFKSVQALESAGISKETVEYFLAKQLGEFAGRY